MTFSATFSALSPAVPETLHAPSARAGSEAQIDSVCVLGLGYVGYPTALLLAKHGLRVTGVDVNPGHLTRCQVETPYPELAQWWQNVAATNPITYAQQPVPADVFLIAVPTPVDPDTKRCDLGAVQTAARSIAQVLTPGGLVILESTVPPGTTRHQLVPILETSGLKAGIDFDVAVCPERVLPGNVCEELVNNQRVVGGFTPHAAARAKAFFARVIAGEILETDDLSAEFCKLAENTYRDVNIALANELSRVADRLGVNIHEARALMNAHPRVNLLTPGIGVGGHCIAVDPWFFAELAPDHTPLIQAARRVNDDMPAYWAAKILQDIAHLSHHPVKIAMLGVSYKPNVGDCRESPALKLKAHLEAAGVEVVAYDPWVAEYSAQALEETVQGADYLAVCVLHDDFLSLRHTEFLGSLQARMRTPLVRWLVTGS